jgi:outer membrane protein TolC
MVLVRRQDLALAEELSAQAHARVDAGTAEGISATRADTRTETIRAQLVSAEGNAHLAAIVLTRALNLDPATTLACTDPLSGNLVGSNAPSTIDEAETIALRSRPERNVSAETLATLEAQYRAQRGARMPKLSAFADAGRAGAATNDTVGVWEAGLQLTIPIVNRTMYDQRAAESRIEQQRLRATDLIARIKAEVNEAVVGNTSAQATLRAAETARSLAERQLAEARTRFAAGVAGNLDVVDAQVTFSQSQEQVVIAQNTAAQARVRLARAVGAAHTMK